MSAAGGAMACRLISVDPHLRELLFAAGACLVASEASMVPIALTRGAAQATVAQAGLVGTMIHLFGCAALGGGFMLMGSLRLHAALMYWLLGMYWLTLIVLVAGFVRAVRAAPVTTTPATLQISKPM